MLGVVSSDAREGEAAMLGAALLGGLCAWQGGHIGKRTVDERQWYVGTPLEATPPAVVDTSVALAHAPPAPAPPARAPPSAKVLQACARVDHNDHIRMRGEFGEFQGYASVIGPDGVEGLRAHHGGGPKSAVPTGLVTWDQIDRMDKRGGSAGKGALYGAFSLGVLGAMLGGAVAASAGGTDQEAAGGVFAGAAVGALFGAGLGAAFGVPVPSWHRVYERPH